MTDAADDIDGLVELCLATGHLDQADAAAVRRHLAAGDAVAASVALEEAIDPYADGDGPRMAVPTVGAVDG